MSAWLCEFETINDAVECIGRVKKLTPQDRTIMGKRLIAMNQKALRARYGRNADRYTRKEIQGYTCGPPSACEVQIIKSAECLAYQCSEGDVPNDTLYLILEACIARMKSKYIVCVDNSGNSKQGERLYDTLWEEAAWGRTAELGVPPAQKPVVADVPAVVEEDEKDVSSAAVT